MKYTIKSYMAIAIATLGLTTSCIETEIPQSGSVLEGQIKESPTAMESLARGIISFGTQAQFFYAADWDFGYPALCIAREEMGDNFASYNSDWDYFTGFGGIPSYLGQNRAYSYYAWKYYYRWNGCVSNVLKVTGEDPEEENARYAAGSALFYRAFIYTDMARLYEFKKTGIARIDDKAEAAGVDELTVPIVTQHSTEEDIRKTPRATYAEMYKFILSDLDKAFEFLDGYERDSKGNPDQSVVEGQRARVWLEIASHYEMRPEKFTAEVQKALGVATVKACWQKAMSYAESAIDLSGAQPLAEYEWYDYTGFNDSKTSAWMLGIILDSKEQLAAENWVNHIATLSVDPEYSNASPYYQTYRMINPILYASIDENDWRRASWIDPEDAGQNAAADKYVLSDLARYFFMYIAPLTGVKFHSTNLVSENYEIGSLADYPIMRVEEMYYILAEATAHVDGVGAGAALLTNFVNTYRMYEPTYKAPTGSMEELQAEIVRQKKIEFWGEGVSFWDTKRLVLPVVRDFEGTNYSKNFRFNSVPGYVPAWFNQYITDMEQGSNPAIIPNPDPSITRAESYTGE